MNTIIQNQRKERDELLARHYLMRKSNTDVKTLLDNPMIKLITGPRRVGKSTYELLMRQGQRFGAYFVLRHSRQVATLKCLVAKWLQFSRDDIYK